MYLNLGATSLKVSIIKHYATLSEKNKTTEVVEVISEAWDEYYGGYTYDESLADILMDNFDSKSKQKGRKVKDIWPAYWTVLQ